MPERLGTILFQLFQSFSPVPQLHYIMYFNLAVACTYHFYYPDIVSCPHEKSTKKKLFIAMVILPTNDQNLTLKVYIYSPKNLMQSYSEHFL